MNAASPQIVRSSGAVASTDLLLIAVKCQGGGGGGGGGGVRSGVHTLAGVRCEDHC